jgi:hypothetical protein
MYNSHDCTWFLFIHYCTFFIKKIFVGFTPLQLHIKYIKKNVMLLDPNHPLLQQIGFVHFVAYSRYSYKKPIPSLHVFSMLFILNWFNNTSITICYLI